MDHSVRFDDDVSPEDLAIKPPKPVTAADLLMKVQVVRSPGEAMLFIAIVISLLISASIYLLASSVPVDSTPDADTTAENRVPSVIP